MNGTSAWRVNRSVRSIVPASLWAATRNAASVGSPCISQWPSVKSSRALFASAPHANVKPYNAPQVILGVLTGNVWVADPLPPAVIDLGVYWRPAA